MKNSEFDLIIAVLSVVQNGKLGAGKPRSLIKIPQKISEVFISEFSVLAIVQNGNLGGEIFSEVSEISENSEFSTLPSEFRSLWIELSVVLCLLDRKVPLMVNDLFYSLGS